MVPRTGDGLKQTRRKLRIWEPRLNGPGRTASKTSKTPHQKSTSPANRIGVPGWRLVKILWTPCSSSSPMLNYVPISRRFTNTTLEARLLWNLFKPDISMIYSVEALPLVRTFFNSFQGITTFYGAPQTRIRFREHWVPFRSLLPPRSNKLIN